MIEAIISRLFTPPVMPPTQTVYHSTRSISLRVESVLSTTSILSKVKRIKVELMVLVLRNSQSISWNKVPIWLLVETTQPEFICMPILILDIPQNKQMRADYQKMPRQWKLPPQIQRLLMEKRLQKVKLLQLMEKPKLLLSWLPDQERHQLKQTMTQLKRNSAPIRAQTLKSKSTPQLRHRSAHQDMVPQAFSRLNSSLKYAFLATKSWLKPMVKSTTYMLLISSVQTSTCRPTLCSSLSYSSSL